MSEVHLGKTICFDYSHNNVLTIESPSYADFTQFLFGSSFRLGKIQAGFTSIEKLKKYKMLVIGGPRQSFIEIEEINVIVEFVKNGGSLLIIHDEGGDYQCETNVSELTEHFGFTYNADTLFDSMDFAGQQNRVIIRKFEPHPVTEGIQQIVQSSACSISINSLIEADENVRIVPLAKTGFNSYKNYWNGEEWIEEEDAPKSILSVAVNYYKGKVLGLSTVSMFSSLSSTYGYFAMDNQKFIANVFNWLLTTKSTEADEKMVNMSIPYTLFSWMEERVNAHEWAGINDIINFSVKYLKDNYKTIMKDINERKKRLKEERKKQLEELKEIKDKGLRSRKEAQLKKEIEIIEKAAPGIDTTKELQEIMATLANITGGEVGGNWDPSILEQQEKEHELKIGQKNEEITAEQFIEDAASEGVASEDAAIEDVVSEDAASEDAAIEDVASEDVAIEDVASEDAAIEDAAIEDATSEDVASEDVASEDAASEDAASEKTQLEVHDVDEIAAEIKKKLTESLQEKTNKNNSTILESNNKDQHDSGNQEDDLLDTMKVLGSFDEFAKKLEEFKVLSDDDEPIELNISKKKNKISDDELFE